MDWLSALFPKRCVSCGELGSYLCYNCVNQCIPLQELYCPHCRKPSAHGATHRYCQQHCRLDGLISTYAYQGTVKRLITKYKYSFAKDIQDTLVELILSASMHPKINQVPWLMVPVPLHSQRHRWRGFNQSEALVNQLSVNWQWPVNPQVLNKITHTPSQRLLSREQRHTNISTAFQVNDKINFTAIDRIMLFDDVATTCSTLSECASVLKQAGVKQVWGFTLAQTVPK